MAELAEIFCTQEEIAKILGLSASTLQHNEEFLQVYKKHLETAKSSLRRHQFKLAEKNPAMAIWLGKQYLGQREPKEEIDVKIVDIPNVDKMTDEEIEKKYSEIINTT